jgi:hypothetical protein
MTTMRKALTTAIIGLAPMLALCNNAGAATPIPIPKVAAAKTQADRPFMPSTTNAPTSKSNALLNLDPSAFRNVLFSSGFHRICRVVPVIVNGEPTGHTRQVCG